MSNEAKPPREADYRVLFLLSFSFFKLFFFPSRRCWNKLLVAHRKIPLFAHRRRALGAQPPTAHQWLQRHLVSYTELIVRPISCFCISITRPGRNSTGILGSTRGVARNPRLCSESVELVPTQTMRGTRFRVCSLLSLVSVALIDNNRKTSDYFGSILI